MSDDMMPADIDTEVAMNIIERQPGDRQRLKELACREKDAHQRDRYRAVMLALDGQQTKDIQVTLDRSIAFVQRWAYAYRDGGVAAVRATPHPGGVPKLPREHEVHLKARIDAGPQPGDGVCTLRGRDIQRILDQQFGVTYSLNGVYDLLHRLGYSCLKPRPRHEKNDPQAMENFRRAAPLLSRP